MISNIEDMMSDLFNPERFTNGVTRAYKSSQAYVPFGLGAGKNLALIEFCFYIQWLYIII